MKSYKQHLNEMVAAVDIHTVANIIRHYLTKKVGKEFFQMPGLEYFIVGGKHYTGVRFFYNQHNCVRFNWVGKKANQDALHSITVWKTKDDRYDINFDHDVSLVKVLPQIVGILKNPHPQEFEFVPDEVPLSENNDSLVESTELIHDIAAYIKKLSVGDKISYFEIKTQLSRQHYKLFRVIVDTNPTVFDISGKSPIFIGNPKTIDYNAAMSLAGGARISVTKTTTNREQIIDDGPAGTIEDEVNRVSLKQQIAHMKGFVKLIKSGATNLLMITGKGGIGKTWNLELELKASGLTDGAGYFRLIGSCSPAAMYETLYKHRKEIVFFDEADTILNDPEARNMVKAATDSGKTRKVTYNKKGKNYYDPAFEAEPDDEDDGDERLPQYFNFEGGIIIVANVGINKLDPDKALRTRGFVMDMQPTREEVLDFIKDIVLDMELPNKLQLSAKVRMEVFNYISEEGSKAQELNIRTVGNAFKVAAAYGGEGGWQEMLQYSA